MKILVLGSTGMLGRYVYKYLSLNKGLHVFHINRYNKEYFDNYFSSDEFDYVINCIGVIKPRINENDDNSVKNAININSLFPYELSEYCEDKCKIIHVTTDCVFSGKLSIGQVYDELSVHDATDVYGKSKSLGELKSHMTLRTSIIGEEVKNKYSLVEWLKKSKNLVVNGYVNHIWNGVTCLQFAKICEEIITKDKFTKGVYCIHSNKLYNKYDLLQLISDIYELDIMVNLENDKNNINRGMRSLYINHFNFNIIDLESQIRDMKDFSSILYGD
jgi:dTDP-4-dehydrorhamnose reductase